MYFVARATGVEVVKLTSLASVVAMAATPSRKVLTLCVDALDDGGANALRSMLALPVLATGSGALSTAARKIAPDFSLPILDPVEVTVRLAGPLGLRRWLRSPR